jgi:hypothetical protein
VNLRVKPELTAAAVEAAQADNRSLTSPIEELLIECCSTTGFLK